LAHELSTDPYNQGDIHLKKMSLKDNHTVGWNFDNSYANQPKNFFTPISPVTVREPRIIVINYKLAKELGLDLNVLTDEHLAQIFSGNSLPPGSKPISQAYAGHQYGQFTYLGDGRAHLIGEHLTPDGIRVDIQLKGSGKTPYGRRGDGRAVLAPMLREYIISEAMYSLGIPTTRSLAVVTTGEPVYREHIEQGAVLTRVASSHLRIGTFQYLSAEEDLHGLKKLADYTLSRHYPELTQTDKPYLNLIKAVMNKQIDLIVHWMRVGFIHGVMNTDNMALSGETIDYGPCAFMDNYDPATVFSSIDSSGRYSYANQPPIAQWNLARFAETLLPLLHEHLEEAISMASEVINEFPMLYRYKWMAMMRAKLGLFGEQPDDEQLILDLLHWMHQHNADYTNTFRNLRQKEQVPEELINNELVKKWLDQWELRLQKNNKPIGSSHHLMNTHNPLIIPRNHHVEQSLTAASSGNLEPFHTLLNALKQPYKNSPELKPYQSSPTPGECIYQTFCGT
jgi:uncharacterized protein YdiU (UPF0061 family)